MTEVQHLIKENKWKIQGHKGKGFEIVERDNKIK
jgi:hypothetical protein